jgi:hypothetical protein
LPGVPSELPTKGNDKGFQDEVNGVYPKYTETDVNRLAVNAKSVDSSGRSADVETNPHSSLTIRKADRTTSIGRADFNEVEIKRANLEPLVLSGDDGTAFDEPRTPYNAQYPYNHVYESEAGHIREIDDTEGAERIHERHATGTGYEIGPDGSKVTRVKQDNYTIVTNDDFAHIKGNSSTTVDGGVRVFVNADGSTGDQNYTIEVGNNANVNIQVNKGDVNVVTTEGDISIKSGGDVNIQADKNMNLSSQNMNLEINGTWNESVLIAKTESTKLHVMNAETQDINGDSVINLN